MVFKKKHFSEYVHVELETPPPLLEKSTLNFHFDYLIISLRSHQAATKWPKWSVNSNLNTCFSWWWYRVILRQKWCFPHDILFFLARRQVAIGYTATLEALHLMGYCFSLWLGNLWLAQELLYFFCQHDRLKNKNDHHDRSRNLKIAQ